MKKTGIPLTLRKISELINGELQGDNSIEIHGVSGIENAQKNEITFLANSKYRAALNTSQAGAIIVDREIKVGNQTVIRVDEPYFAFLKVLKLFATEAIEKNPTGIHESAITGENLKLGESVSIQGETVIGDNVKIGDETVIYPFVFIGDDVEIGANVRIYPNVTIREKVEIGNRVIIHSGASIGSDGFGFVTVKGEHHKIPQLGKVVIEADVEIGANSTIDRATLENSATTIRRGTKIDNLVQIAHNVEIGEACLIVAQTGISGSTKIGDRVTIAGQVGIAGHLTVGDNNLIFAKSGVTKNIPDSTGGVSGFPAMPHNEELRLQATQRKIPSVMNELASLKDRIAELEATKL